MLTDSNIKELISALFVARKNALWIIGHIPVTEVQKECIEKVKELLKQINQYLMDFGVKLPN